jgi:hypothetical protein
MSADYPMDEGSLRQELSQRTALLIGNVTETVPEFVRKLQNAPVGFIAFDLDLYTSTRDALKIFVYPERKMLRKVTVYFDDIDSAFNHRFAGELLAIDEFNRSDHGVKIDRWRGLAKERIFPDHSWIKKMYMAHDLEAINKVKPQRQPLKLG